MKLANQALFDLLYDEHGLILVESELHEVELVVNKDLQSQLQAENARLNTLAESAGDDEAIIRVALHDIAKKVKWLADGSWKHYPKGSTEKELLRLVQDAAQQFPLAAENALAGEVEVESE